MDEEVFVRPSPPPALPSQSRTRLSFLFLLPLFFFLLYAYESLV